MEDEEESDAEEETNEDAEEVPYSKPPQVKKVTSGKYFKDLIKLPLKKLLDHSTAKSAFAKAMEYPLQQLREKTAKAKLEGKPLEVIEWPTDDEVQELIDLLKSIDKGFDISIRAWGKFKSHMPVLYGWYQTHVRHGKYLSEFSKCDKSSCTICRLSSEGLRTPNTEDGMLRYTLLRPMDRPVNNPSDPGHFLPPNKTAEYIAEKKLTFQQLMKELPNKDSHPFQCAQAKADKSSDDTAGGSKLFKGDKVRDIAICKNCNFGRAIYSMWKINSTQQGLSKREQQKRLKDLETFKESYLCGNACTVEGFETKRTLRCGEMIESQYFTFAKKSTNEWSVDICCMCGNDEALLSIDNMKDKFPQIGGRTPLRMCDFCANLGIMPPTTNAATSFTEKKVQQKTSKKRTKAVIGSLSLTNKKSKNN